MSPVIHRNAGLLKSQSTLTLGKTQEEFLLVRKISKIFVSTSRYMRKTQVYVEDPWDVDSYATKLKTLYRAMHGLKRTSPVDDAKVQQYSE